MGKTSEQAGLFDVFVSYESIAGYLKSLGPDDRRDFYRADFLSTAARKPGNDYKRDIDPVTDTFWNAAYQMATKDFLDLEMKPPAFTRGTRWVEFRPNDMPTQPRVGARTGCRNQSVTWRTRRRASALFQPQAVRF
jgi:hypothetical protein